MKNITNDFETDYQIILAELLDNIDYGENRTAVRTTGVFGRSMTVDLSLGFPAITGRAVAPRIAFEETWMFLRGQTDTTVLEDKGINIWTGNTSREFLDNAGLKYLPTGSMGKGYSHQWRNWNGRLKNSLPRVSRNMIQKLNWSTLAIDPKAPNALHQRRWREDRGEYIKRGLDQVAELLQGLKDNPTSRRHIITGWNPSDLKESALPPCHLYQQYQVKNGKLNSTFVLRSWDFFLRRTLQLHGLCVSESRVRKVSRFRTGQSVRGWDGRSSVRKPRGIGA